MPVIGIDGTPKGFVAVKIDDDGFQDAFFSPTFQEILRACPADAVVGVDMPVGLLGDARFRRCDIEGRVALGKTRARLFLVPPRTVVDLSNYADALAQSRRETGAGFSKQAFNLFPKIREVDAFVDDERVFEVHPELSFMVMNDGAPVFASKKTWQGNATRLALLRKNGIVIPTDGARAGLVPIDDVVDAAAVAWTARRILRSTARSFPFSTLSVVDDDADHDRCGRRLAIYA